MPGDASDPPVNRDRDEPFLKRWSRRKQAADQGDAAHAPAETDAADDERAPPSTTDDAADTATEEAAPTDADLPPPESLDRDSDFSAYLSGRVSSGLRRAAMRRLFSLPEFNVRDGLDDYDEDYTQFKSLGDTVTAHMRHHRERLRRRDEAREAARAQEQAEADQAQPRAPTAADEADTGPDDDPARTGADESATRATRGDADERDDQRDHDDTT